jgi:hypothetical protein
MFFDERFSRPGRVGKRYRPVLAPTVVRSGPPRPTGMGVYEYNTQYAQAAQQQAGRGWALEQYGEVGDDTYRQRVHDLILDGVSSMLAAGQVTPEEAGAVRSAADSGAFLYPSMASEVAADSLAKTAFYYMLSTSGWLALRTQVFGEVKTKVQAEAVAAASRTAVWEAIAKTMEMVSGATLVDKVRDLLARINGEVRATNELLAQARQQLSPERYALVAKEASGVQAQLTYLEKYVPGATQDTGTVGLGFVLTGTIALAAAAAICALVWAYVASKKTAVANKQMEMVEDQRKAEVDAANKNPSLSPEEKQAAIAAAGDRAKKGADAAAATAKAASAGGLFGIDFKWLAIAGVAVAGVMILPAILGALPKRSTAKPAQA